MHNGKLYKYLSLFYCYEVANFVEQDEREEVKPSIEMATQLAEALEVSLDYLVGSTDILLDKNIVAKILDIQKLKENDRQHVFALLDAFLKQTKLQSIM
ncbi:hypothetical protein BBH99_18940 [Chryseobacterium contaminans]|uniref:HTH cro/C1-type domain-containing protein n=1 Tax=Chryseobacterium contaminans TaxID=1423959 RepID=A0A1M7IUF0_9FLAO|nr:hypothetical protein BBH99_18940 [Chryseobacterium contaminans]SHM43947.1 hypothetical protein SAMN05444407_1205 [Chryseobacterium contaminans]